MHACCVINKKARTGFSSLCCRGRQLSTSPRLSSPSLEMGRLHSDEYSKTQISGATGLCESLALFPDGSCTFLDRSCWRNFCLRAICEERCSCNPVPDF